jgi:hypothetical protein
MEEFSPEDVFSLSTRFTDEEDEKQKPSSRNTRKNKLISAGQELEKSVRAIQRRVKELELAT